VSVGRVACSSGFPVPRRKRLLLLNCRPRYPSLSRSPLCRPSPCGRWSSPAPPDGRLRTLGGFWSARLAFFYLTSPRLFLRAADVVDRTAWWSWGWRPSCSRPCRHSRAVPLAVRRLFSGSSSYLFLALPAALALLPPRFPLGSQGHDCAGSPRRRSYRRVVTVPFFSVGTGAAFLEQRGSRLQSRQPFPHGFAEAWPRGWAARGTTPQPSSVIGLRDGRPLNPRGMRCGACRGPPAGFLGRPVGRDVSFLRFFRVQTRQAFCNYYYVFVVRCPLRHVWAALLDPPGSVPRKAGRLVFPASQG